MKDPSLNALDFEREVIEFFGPLYGFDLDDRWGIVTFSGTDGNNHGIYFGSKYLEKKTQQKLCERNIHSRENKCG